MGRPIKIQGYTRFLLYLAVVVLVNLAATTLFFRTDLTANRIYSLSPASKEVVATLSEPLTIKIFFTSNLPAPYNNIERYLHDLLQEYAVAGNRYFNYQFYNVSGETNDSADENQQLARNYGIPTVQVQNIEQDEVKFQTAQMGMALIHGDLIETIPTITSTEGLEFEITSTIRRMNNKISALLALKDSVNVQLILSSSLQMVGPYMNLAGLPQLPGQIEKIVARLNEKNYGKLSFAHLDPTRDGAIEAGIQHLPVLPLRWNAFTDRQGNKIPADKGYAGIVLQHGGKAEYIPLINVVRLPIFGTQYVLTELDNLENAINEGLENLIHINEEIGYLADHGTYGLAGQPGMPGQPQPDSLANLHQLLSREYTVKEVSLNDEGIPAGLPTLIIAGAKESFSDYELFQIDQFLMRGRNLAVFVDAFEETMAGGPSNPMMMGQSRFMPLNTGLEKLLNHYGVDVKASYILDENSYKQRVPEVFGGGEQTIYYAPIIKNEFINKDVAYLRNIKGLVMLKAAPVEVDQQKIAAAGLKAERLFASSERAWEMSETINLNPMFLRPPDRDEDYHQLDMAYMLEGNFPSYFANKPVPVKETNQEDTPAEPENADAGASGTDMSQIESEGQVLKTGRRGKIFLIGSAEILKDNVIDDAGRGPNAQFVMNVIDALNGREAYAVMRSKTQRFNPLRDVSPATKTAIKTANVLGLPALIVAAGLLVWFRRSARKRLIQQIFSR